MPQILGKKRLAVESLVPWSTWLTPNAKHYRYAKQRKSSEYDNHENGVKTCRKRFMTDFFVLPVDGEPEVR